MNVLVTGANGQLGQEIRKVAHDCSCPSDKKIFYTDVNKNTDIDELDIASLSSIRTYVNNNKINFIVNCAAYTAVDKAESEPAKAELINKIGPANLAKVCVEFDIPLIHISTDFVFDGTKKTPYLETDKANPMSVYGKTKLDGEEEIIKQNGTFIIIRTSWLYSEYGNNFVKTIIKHAQEKTELKVVNDQIGSPTYAEDLADVILQMIPRIKKGTKEIFHYSNEGVASWYDFAVKIVELKKLNCKILPIETKDYPTAAQRPAYSVMDTTKMKKYFDIKITTWQDSLKKCISKLGSNR